MILYWLKEGSGPVDATDLTSFYHDNWKSFDFMEAIARKLKLPFHQFQISTFKYLDHSTMGRFSGF
ncbi:MAG: hypothetical protein ACLSCE_18885 [Bacteroides cellulosilyticus]